MQFTGIEYNVQPYCLGRSVNEFPHFCLVLQVDTTDKSYEKAKQLIRSYDFSIGKGFEVDIQSKLDKSKIKNKCVYIVDLRAKPDKSLDPITIVNSKKEPVPKELLAALLEQFLNQSRGLVVIGSNADDIPRVMFSRSQLGFTSKNNLEQFLLYGCNFHPAGENRLYVQGQLQFPIRTKEQEEEQTLCGYNQAQRVPLLQYI